MESNKKIINSLEKILYTILVMITIVAITFLSYSEKIKFYLCPIILFIEFIVFLFLKSKKMEKFLDNLKNDSEKVQKIKKITYISSIILTLIFVSLITFALYNILNSDAFSFLYEVLSVNLISFIGFVILIGFVFILARKEKDNKAEDNIEIEEGIKLNNKLSAVVYSLFVLITCIVPFVYEYFTDTISSIQIIWVIGCLSNLIFGVLTSVILRTVKYKKTSYNILALSIMFVCLMGIFSQMGSFIISYILFLVSVLISMIAFVLYNKNNEVSVIILTILLIAIMIGQILI